MRMCHFQVQNGPFVLNKNFLVQTIITFIYLLTLFIEQNLKEFLQQIQSYEMCHFWTQNGPSAPNNFFFGKLLISLSSTYQPLSLCKILKKFFQQILSQRMRKFWAQNGPFSQMRIFPENLLSFVSSIHAHLHAKNQSQILTLLVPIPDEQKTIKLNFYFHLSLWCLDRFYESLKGLHKTF